MHVEDYLNIYLELKIPTKHFGGICPLYYENKTCVRLSMLPKHLKTVSHQHTKDGMATKTMFKDWKKWKKS